MRVLRRHDGRDVVASMRGVIGHQSDGSPVYSGFSESKPNVEIKVEPQYDGESHDHYLKRSVESMAEQLTAIINGQVVSITPITYQPRKPEKPRERNSCTFCGKSLKEVRQMVAADYVCQGNPVCICDECVGQCVELLAKEPTKTTPKHEGP